MATIVIDAGHEEQTRELFLKEDRKKTIHCGWHWQWERFWRKTDRM